MPLPGFLFSNCSSDSPRPVVICRATRCRLFLAKEQRRERLLAVPLRAPDPRNIGSAISGNRDWVSERPFLHPLSTLSISDIILVSRKVRLH